MLDAFKRLIDRRKPLPKEWGGALVWAERQQARLRPLPGGAGLQIDGETARRAWRLEWGPSTRPYIDGHELRLRADVGLPPDLQALLVDRRLRAQMEAVVFGQYVDGVQTRIDDRTPPEMRWLVMHPSLGADALGALRDDYDIVASSRAWAGHWLAGPLANALADLRRDPTQSVALVITGSRLTLRTSLAVPTATALGLWHELFVLALREARGAAEALPADRPSGESELPSGAMPDDAEGDPRR